jgi:hypothetical protein
MDVRPSIFDELQRGYFEVCDLFYYPHADYNSWNYQDDEVVSMTAALFNGTEKYDPREVGKGNLHGDKDSGVAFCRKIGFVVENFH